MNICMTGIYKCNNPKKYYYDPNDKEYKYLYHCRNWTFTVGKIDEYIYLYDTYFGDKCIFTTFDEFETDFELVVDLSEFHKVDRKTDLREYDKEDICIVPDCSAGTMNPSKYVRNSAEKNIDRMLLLLADEISFAERDLARLKQKKEQLLQEKKERIERRKNTRQE